MQTPETKNELIRQARKEDKNIESESGVLCVLCAEMSDWEYEWSTTLVTRGGCYNCGE